MTREAVMAALAEGMSKKAKSLCIRVIPFLVRRILNFVPLSRPKAKLSMARPLKIAWKHPAEVFYQLYKQELDARIAKRWQALWMLRRGERLKRVKELVGVAHVSDG